MGGDWRRCGRHRPSDDRIEVIQSSKSLSFPNALVPTLVSLSRNLDRIVGIGNPDEPIYAGPPIKTFGGDNFEIRF